MEPSNDQPLIDRNPSGAKEQKFLLLYTPSFKLLLSVTLFLLAVAALIRFRVFPQFTSAYLGGAEYDAGLYVWLTKRELKEFFELGWFNTKAFFPYARSLAWSDNFILPTLLVQLLSACGLPHPAAYNAVALAATFLNGLFTFLLAFALSGAALPALLAGTAFMSYSFFTAHLGHPQLQFAFFAPLTFLLLFRFIGAPAFRRAFFIGGSLWLCFLTTVYYAVFIAIGLVVLLAAIALLRPGCFQKVDGRCFVSGAGLGLAPVIFFALPYFDARDAFGTRFLYEALAFAANGCSYFSAGVFNFLYGFSAVLSHSEAQLFPGIMILLLAFFAFLRVTEGRKLRRLRWTIPALLLLTLVTTLKIFPEAHEREWRYLAAPFMWGLCGAFGWLLYRLGCLERKLNCRYLSNRSLLAALLAAALLYFTISLGPLGDEGGFAPGVHWLFYQFLPGFASIRAVGRIGVFTVLFLVLAVPLVLKAYLPAIKRQNLFALGLIFCVVFENFNVNFPMEQPAKVSAAIARLKESSFPGDVAIVLPLAGELDPQGQIIKWSTFAKLNTRYLNQLSDSGAYLVNGYSGQRTNLMHRYPARMAAFPDFNSIETLSQIAGLRFIIYDANEVPHFNSELFEKKLSTYSAQLKLIMRDAGGRYLIEFSDKTRITASFSLGAPSFPQGRLELELMALSNSSAATVPLRVAYQRKSRRVPIGIIPVKTTGAWQNYTIALPDSGERVKPFKIVFEPPQEAGIYLKRRVWYPN